MTERMENALNHIKTSVDVDPWATEEVERVFKAIDRIRKSIKEIMDCDAIMSYKSEYYTAKYEGLKEALDVIDEELKKERKA